MRNVYENYFYCMELSQALLRKNNRAQEKTAECISAVSCYVRIMAACGLARGGSDQIQYVSDNAGRRVVGDDVSIGVAILVSRRRRWHTTAIGGGDRLKMHV